MHLFYVSFKFVQINVCMLTVYGYSVNTHYTYTHFMQYTQQPYEVILGLQREEPVTGRVRNYPTAFNQPVVWASALNCSCHSISANKHYNNCWLSSSFVPVYGSLAMAAFLSFLSVFLMGVFLTKFSGVKRKVTLMRVFYVFICMLHMYSHKYALK